MPIFGITASSNQFARLGDFSQIATTTVGATAVSSVVFDNIPQTYTHLQVRYIAQTSRTSGNYGFLYLRFNDDTGTNYSSHELYGDGSAVGVGSGVTWSEPWIGYCGRTANTSIFGAGVCDILDYANTNKFKTTRTISGVDNNGSGYSSLDSSNWRSTSGITKITILDLNVGVNITQYSSFALYGVKA